MMIPLHVIIDAPLSTWFGAAGLAGQLVWPMFQTRTSILTAQFGIASCYATQYALMGQGSGTCVCLVGATQTAIALIAGDKPWLNRLRLGFIPLALLLGYLTWSGLPSAFATSACCLIMIGRMQRDLLRMRAIMLSAAPFGIGYDLAVGALPALLGAILSLAIGVAALRREWLTRHRNSRPASAEAAAATD